jgi:hypothetical protein
MVEHRPRSFRRIAKAPGGADKTPPDLDIRPMQVVSGRHGLLVHPLRRGLSARVRRRRVSRAVVKVERYHTQDLGKGPARILSFVVLQWGLAVRLNEPGPTGGLVAMRS